MISPSASRFLFLTFIWLVTGFSSLQALTVTGLKVFGDSLSDQGNSEATLGVPSFYSSSYYQGRWSNGPVWVEYLNSALGFAPLARNGGMASTGSNFAYGGSTTGSQTDIYGGALHDLQMQVGSYVDHEADDDTLKGTELFVVWSGGNDVINDVQGTTPGDALDGPGNISLAIANLYGAGARQFLVPNLPALGFKPSFRSTANEGLANNLVDQFNNSLSSELDELQVTYPDIVILRLDVYSLVNNILLNPDDYGFTNVTDGALNVGAIDPEHYLFWDDTHPTTAGHLLIANEALGMIPEPQTVVLTGMGLILIFGSVYSRRFRTELAATSGPNTPRQRRRCH